MHRHHTYVQAVLKITHKYTCTDIHAHAYIHLLMHSQTCVCVSTYAIASLFLPKLSVTSYYIQGPDSFAFTFT